MFLTSKAEHIPSFKTVHFLFSAFLTFFYPLVPTLTFLAVFWVKGSDSTASSSGRDGNATENAENGKKQKTYKMLTHWARMAPIIEGGIEAPIQFLFQVSKIQEQD